MRNPSKTTIKRIFRMDNGEGLCNGWGPRHTNYFLFNQVGTRLYHMSKKKICNRGMIGFERYMIKKQ